MNSDKCQKLLKKHPESGYKTIDHIIYATPGVDSTLEAFVNHQKNMIKKIKGCEAILFVGPNYYKGEKGIDPLASETGSMTAFLKSGLYHLYDHLIHTPGVKYDADDDVYFLIIGLKTISNMDDLPETEKKVIQHIFHTLIKHTKTSIGSKQWFDTWKQSMMELHEALAGPGGYKYYKQKDGTFYSLDTALRGVQGPVSQPLIERMTKDKYLDVRPFNIWEFHPPYMTDSSDPNGFFGKKSPNELGPFIDKIRDLLYSEKKHKTNKTMKTAKYALRHIAKFPTLGLLYKRYKTRKAIAAKERNILRSLKQKYDVENSSNLVKTIQEALNINKQIFRTSPKNIQNNLYAAKTIYGKRSKTRKAFNRVKKTVRQWFKTQRH